MMDTDRNGRRRGGRSARVGRTRTGEVRPRAEIRKTEDRGRSDSWGVSSGMDGRRRNGDGRDTSGREGARTDAGKEAVPRQAQKLRSSGQARNHKPVPPAMELATNLIRGRGVTAAAVVPDTGTRSGQCPSAASPTPSRRHTLPISGCLQACCFMPNARPPIQSCVIDVSAV